MASEQFTVSDTNPNDAVGGGGCVCSETESPDCKPPYAVFYASETASNISPHTVICLNCAAAFVEAAKGEVAQVGEKDPEQEIITTATVVELPPDDFEEVIDAVVETPAKEPESFEDAIAGGWNKDAPGEVPEI